VAAACLQHRQRLGRGTGQLEESIAHEGIEGHQRSHRIAGQREQPAAAAGGAQRPKANGRPGRIATFQNATSPRRASSVRVKSASPALTPRWSARHRPAPRGLERGLQRCRIVRHEAEVDDLHAQALQRGISA